MRVRVVYYEDFCREFTQEAEAVFGFLGLPFVEEVVRWHEKPHHDAWGRLVRNLKYPDEPIRAPQDVVDPEPILAEELERAGWVVELWRKRML